MHKVDRLGTLIKMEFVQSELCLDIHALTIHSEILDTTDFSTKQPCFESFDHTDNFILRRLTSEAAEKEAEGMSEATKASATYDQLGWSSIWHYWNE